MITLRNNFHGTEYRTKGGYLSARTVKKIHKALCGVTGCMCSNDLGVRGPQDKGVSIMIHYSNEGKITATITGDK